MWYSGSGISGGSGGSGGARVCKTKSTPAIAGRAQLRASVIGFVSWFSQSFIQDHSIYVCFASFDCIMLCWLVDWFKLGYLLKVMHSIGLYFVFIHLSDKYFKALLKNLYQIYWKPVLKFISFFYKWHKFYEYQNVQETLLHSLPLKRAVK